MAHAASQFQAKVVDLVSVIHLTGFEVDVGADFFFVDAGSPETDGAELKLWTVLDLHFHHDSQVGSGGLGLDLRECYSGVPFGRVEGLDGPVENQLQAHVGERDADGHLVNRPQDCARVDGLVAGDDNAGDVLGRRVGGEEHYQFFRIVVTDLGFYFEGLRGILGNEFLNGSAVTAHDALRAGNAVGIQRHVLFEVVSKCLGVDPKSIKTQGK